MGAGDLDLDLDRALTELASTTKTVLMGLVRVGVQSAIAHPETAAFMKKLMAEKGLVIPPDITSSICLTKGLKGCQ